MLIDYRLQRPVAIEARVRVEGFTVLAGASGEGKTCLLRAIAGLLPAEGEPYRGLLPQHRPIGYLPQGYGLFPHLRAWENVAFALPRASNRRDRALALMARLGIAGLAERFPASLSGGQRPRQCHALLFPGVSSSAWHWRGRWRGSRNSCCSTSRPRRSIRPHAMPSWVN